MRTAMRTAVLAAAVMAACCLSCGQFGNLEIQVLFPGDPQLRRSAVVESRGVRIGRVFGKDLGPGGTVAIKVRIRPKYRQFVRQKNLFYVLPTEPGKLQMLEADPNAPHMAQGERIHAASGAAVLGSSMAEGLGRLLDGAEELSKQAADYTKSDKAREQVEQLRRAAGNLETAVDSLSREGEEDSMP